MASMTIGQSFLKQPQLVEEYGDAEIIDINPPIP
jgi:hypothetical protein